MELEYQKPLILYMDSFGVWDPKYIFCIRKMIEFEYIEKYAQSEEDKKTFQITKEILPIIQPIVPRQSNFTDCGLYALEYIESFLLDPNEFMKDIQNPSKWDKLDLFPKSLIQNKRDLILQVMINMSK